MGHAFQKKCPVCGKAPGDKLMPFCSQRCADIDLGAWLSEKYRVPTNDAPDVRLPGDSDEEA